MGKWITQVISPQVEYQRYENKVRARDSRLYTRKHSLFFYAKFTYPIMKGQLAQVVERHISVKVTSSNLVLFLLYFMKGEFL